MSAAGIITGKATAKAGATLIARVVGNDALPVTRISLSAINYAVQNVTTAVLIGTGALTISTVIFDALQTDKNWTKDAVGYNFKWTVPASLLQNGGDKYQVDVKFTPVTGEVFIQSWQFTLQKTY